MYIAQTECEPLIDKRKAKLTLKQIWIKVPDFLIYNIIFADNSK